MSKKQPTKTKTVRMYGIIHRDGSLMPWTLRSDKADVEKLWKECCSDVRYSTCVTRVTLISEVPK